MVVPRPVSRLLIVEIHSLPDFVVVGGIFLAVIRIVLRISWKRRSGNKRQDFAGGHGPSRLRDHTARENTARRWIRAAATREAIRLPLRHGVTQTLRKHLCPVRAVDRTGQECRVKIAEALVCRRYRDKASFRTLHLPRALIIREPENFVFPERPARRIAKLIAPQFGLACRKVILGIQLVVTQELKNVSVKSVGARLSDGIDDRTAEFSVFGVKT